MDEKSQLKTIQDRIRDLIKPLRQAADKKWVKSPTIEELAKLQTAIPKGASLGEAVDAVSESLRALITEIRKARAEGFGRLISEYIRQVKAQGANPMESGSSRWRIGEIELELRPEVSLARTVYNQSPMFPASGWAVITATEDLIKLRGKALEMLKEAEAQIPDDLVKSLFAECYQTVLAKRRAAMEPRAELVPILDLHRSFRIALFTRELDGQKPDRVFVSGTMLRWVFLHVLDRYHRMSTQIEQKDRLIFQTGSQAEVAKGMGYILGGLNPQQKYWVYCHVLLSS